MFIIIFIYRYLPLDRGLAYELQYKNRYILCTVRTNKKSNGMWSISLITTINIPSILYSHMIMIMIVIEVVTINTYIFYVIAFSYCKVCTVKYSSPGPSFLAIVLFVVFIIFHLLEALSITH